MMEQTIIAWLGWGLHRMKKKFVLGISVFLFFILSVFVSGLLTDDNIAYYKADTSGSFPDETPSGYDGTISGATYTSSGKINGAYDCDGSNDYISLFSANVFTNDFTISLWVKPDSWASGSYDTILAARDTGYIILSEWDGGVAAYLTPSSNYRLAKSNSAPPTDGTWTHLAFTWNKSGSKVTIYLNGVDATDGRLGTGTGVLKTPGTFRLCQDSGVSGREFDGSVDEISFWDRILTDDEILDVYNSGNGKQYPYSTEENAVFFGANW